MGKAEKKKRSIKRRRGEDVGPRRPAAIHSAIFKVKASDLIADEKKEAVAADAAASAPVAPAASAAPAPGADSASGAPQIPKNPSQRHKLEWKLLRKKLQELRHDRLKLRKARIETKAERKKLTQEIKQLEQEFKERVSREIEEYKAALAAAQAAGLVVPNANTEPASFEDEGDEEMSAVDESSGAAAAFASGDAVVASTAEKGKRKGSRKGTKKKLSTKPIAGAVLPVPGSIPVPVVKRAKGAVKGSKSSKKKSSKKTGVAKMEE